MTSQGQKWPGCDAPTKRFTESVVEALTSCLGDNLEAVYLHGSLELSIILARHAAAPRHPVPFELHFGADYTAAIRDDSYDYSRAKGEDPDLCAHLSVTRLRGIALYGPPSADMIGPVAWTDYIAAVQDDLDWILDGENILISPFYGVLNICRVLEMQTKGEGTVSSKEEAALWALAALPSSHHDVIQESLACYRDPAPVTPQTRQKGGREWDEGRLLAFRDFARREASRHHTPGPAPR